MSMYETMTVDELRALQILAERGWSELKKEHHPGLPYGAPPLTDRASLAMIDAMTKLDIALSTARENLKKMPRPEGEKREPPLTVRHPGWRPSKRRTWG